MSDPATSGRRVRGGGRAARLALREAAPAADRKPIWAGMEGGSYNPLSARDLERIHDAALDILSDVGVGSPTDEVIELATAKGCRLNSKGRLIFPRALVEDR
jgi:trimethylamine--corrinoid protein Co-methyltransferase